MYQLKITRKTGIQSTLVDLDISPAQLSIIVALLKAGDALTYGDVLEFLAHQKQKLTFDAPAGAGDAVEAFRG
jgi:hypothetical protein